MLRPQYCTVSTSQLMVDAVSVNMFLSRQTYTRKRSTQVAIYYY